MAKPNRWVDFIRKWAKENNVTYSCALSSPKCKADYRAKYGIRKGVPAKTERERMGLEDVNRAAKPKPKTSFKERVEEVIRKAKAQPDEPKTAKRMKKVKDIVKKKFDGRVYYANRFTDYPEAYGVVDGKVMIIGEVGDYSSLDLFDDPKPVASNVRFYDDDNKPIKLLNDLQEKMPKKKLRIVEDEGVEFVLPQEVRDRIVVAEPPTKKKHTRRPPEPAQDDSFWNSLMRASQEGMERRGGKKGAKAIWRSTKKGIQKGLDSTAEVLNMINPVYQMNTRAPEVGAVMGELSYNYALPAMVSMGYYAYIAAAESAATMMGLPPQVGREAAEILWDEMVVKQDADPRERQKSQFLGTVADRSGRLAFGGSFYRL